LGYSAKGVIDEAKFYNAALTSDEIKLDYNHGSAMVLGSSNQIISGTSTPLEYCIPGDVTACSSPIAEYNFEEGQGGVNDTSGNGNTGTWAGTGNHWVSGKIGKAGNFTNATSDYITVADNSLLQFGTDNFTVESWIKFPINGHPTNGWDGIISKGYTTSAPAHTWGLIRTSTNTNQVSFQDSIDAGGSWNANLTSPSFSNGWHHITVTRSGTLYSIFSDGILTTSGTYALTDLSTTADLLIGSEAGRYFTGSLDSIRIYDYARSAAQIAWDYNRGGPVGQWKFDECQGTIANDSSGNGGIGTIVIGGGGNNSSAGTCTGSSGQAWKDGAIGKFNSSLEFDGYDDNVSIPITATNGQDIKGPISYAVWFKRSDNGAYQTLVNKIDACSGSINGFVLRFTSTDTLTFDGWKTTNVFGTSYNSSTMSDGNWHHAVASWDGTTNTNGVKIYIDSVLVSQATSTADTFASLAGYYQKIGSLTCNAHYFNGQIDDVRVYNYALTPTQIKQVYNNGAVNFGPATGSP
jgi:hypothetical protein